MARTTLSRPSFYVYFRDRHQLLVRLVEGIGRELFDGASIWLEGDGDPRDEPRAAVARRVRRARPRAGRDRRRRRPRPGGRVDLPRPDRAVRGGHGERIERDIAARPVAPMDGRKRRALVWMSERYLQRRWAACRRTPVDDGRRNARRRSGCARCTPTPSLKRHASAPRSGGATDRCSYTHWSPAHLDVALAELAARQHGIVSRRQLLELGFTERSVQHRIAMKRLHRIHPGVYAVGHVALLRLARYMAAVLACGDDAVLSHRAAAAVWTARGRLRTGRCDGPARRRRLGAASRYTSPDHCLIQEVTEVESIPCTTPMRTLVDLAAVLQHDAS